MRVRPSPSPLRPDASRTASEQPPVSAPRVDQNSMLPAVPTPRHNPLTVPPSCWGLPAAPAPAPALGQAHGEASPAAGIEDFSTVTSQITLSGGVPTEQVSLSLDLEHTWPGDLRVTLEGPQGQSLVLWDRKPAAISSLKGTFALSGLPVQPADGEWTLKVEDLAGEDSGVLLSWALDVAGELPRPPPPVENPDRDAMKHIEYLASAELQGRDSPSAGLDLAAKYIAERLEKYGLKGPNPTDAQGPYFQTFETWGFQAKEGSAAQQKSGPEAFGHALFEDGFYLDEQLKPEDLALLQHRHAQLEREGRATAKAPKLDSIDDVKAIAERTGKVQNVMGLLEGSGPHKDEVIVVMAHYDHVGVDRSGVHPGADDNASGTAALLAALPDLAEKQKRGELDRSILILWTAAEEKGLVGSKYFIDHPIPGISSKEITGVINTDMVGRWDDQRLSVIDKTKGQANYLRDVVEQSNQQLADPFDKLNRDIDQYTNRQDGYNFARAGEDVLFLFEGLSNPNGGGSLNPDYHQPGDTPDKIYRDNDGKKPGRVRDLLVNMLAMASNRQVPAAPEAVDWK